MDRIGDKSLRDNTPIYDRYADNHIYNIDDPGLLEPRGVCSWGSAAKGFVVNLGEVFDLVNLNPLGPENGEENTLADKNVTTLALEVPISCLVARIRSSAPGRRPASEGPPASAAAAGRSGKCRGHAAASAAELELRADPGLPRLGPPDMRPRDLVRRRPASSARSRVSVTRW